MTEAFIGANRKGVLGRIDRARSTVLSSRRDRHLSATVTGIAAALLVASTALADTCCANIPVELEPSVAKPGDAVRLVAIQCLTGDSAEPLPLDLGAFWLATTDRAAAGQDVPGPGLPQELPPVDQWLAFDALPDAGATVGDATIIVPDLPGGTYQLWWWCTGQGPGGGIHYSTGSRLTIRVVPDTATTSPVPGSPSAPGWPLGLLLVVGSLALIGTMRSLDHRARR